MLNSDLLITLHGRPTQILRKNRNTLTFSFDDDNFGSLILTAHKNECILYYDLFYKQRYILKVKLIGRKYEDKYGEENFYNNLQVKQVLKGGEEDDAKI